MPCMALQCNANIEIFVLKPFLKSKMGSIGHTSKYYEQNSLLYRRILCAVLLNTPTTLSKLFFMTRFTKNAEFYL